jgi:hypothetical protein
MSEQNIFSALAKYNSARDENYLTEAFVFLINSLLLRERPIGLEILTQLCVENNEFSFNTDEAISVSTQETTEQGTPDIKVSSPDKLIYIEVKHDSPLGAQQLERYKKALESSTATIQHVVLLTRFVVDFEEQEEKPYKHVCWFEVYNWLASARDKAQDSVSGYLIEQFMSFLEVKRMSIQKVGWEYINGVPAFNNLISMIEAAIRGASIPLYKKSVAWEYKGFHLENAEFWCGISYYDPSPMVVIFQIVDKQNFDAKRVPPSDYSAGENEYSIFFNLQLEKIHFFALDKDKQLEEITNFVKAVYSDAQKMKVKEAE